MKDVAISRVETLPVALPTLADFAVSGGSVARAGEPSVRVLVKATASDGTFGWGEATPIPSWGRTRRWSRSRRRSTGISRWRRPGSRSGASTG